MRYLVAILFVGAAFGQVNGCYNASTGSNGVITLTPCSTPPPVNLCLAAPTGLPPLPQSTVQPQLPQSCNVPVYPTPTSEILANSTATLQSALANVKCGQAVKIQAGIVYQGNFVVPGLACTASAPVLVYGSGIAALPAGQYPPQSLSGTSAVPTIASATSQASLQISDNAANWYFAGLEITLMPAAINNYPIVAMGETTTTAAALPHNITFDRVLVHPAPCLNDSMTAKCHYVARGIDLNAVNGTVMYSTIYGIVNAGQDAQAININNTPGPGLILGNYLEATGENLMFNTECTLVTQTGNAPNGVPWGSTGWTTGTIGITTCPAPSDFTVRLNHFKKLMAWQTLPAGCNPSAYQCYTVKNQFEVKHGQRILNDSNLFDTTFSAAQAGFIISNCFAAGIYICQDLTSTSNVFMHGPNVGSVSGNGWPVTGGSAITTGTRTLVRNNLALDIDGVAYGGPLCLKTAPYTGCAGGATLQMQHTYNYTIDHNTFINRPSQYQNAMNFTDYPPSTDIATQITNHIQFGSPFANAMNPGGTIANLPSPAMGGVWFVGDYWSYKNIWGADSAPAYPAGVVSLSSPAVSVPGNPPVTCQNNNNVMQSCWPLDWPLVGMVDWQSASTGVSLAGAALSPTSTLKGKGTDGTDPGANIPAVLAAISSIK